MRALLVTWRLATLPGRQKAGGSTRGHRGSPGALAITYHPSSLEEFIPAASPAPGRPEPWPCGANLDVKGGSGAITPPGPKQQFVPRPGLNTLHLLSLNPAGPGGHLAALWAQVGVMWGLLLAGGGSHKSLSPPSSGVPGEVGWGSLLGLWAWRGAGCGDPWG